jgi:threonine/homoserine/homoserine lactone efflux protein
MRIGRAGADKSRYGAVVGIPFVFEGILIGVSMAAPLGPIGILCLNRTLAEGPRLGFICGLGAASAEALYALAGSVALFAIGQWLIDDRTLLRTLGGVFLLYLGARTFMRPTIVLPPSVKLPTLLPPGWRAAFTSTFLLSVANPITIFSFAAVFAGLGVAPAGILKGADSAAAALVAGVFVGSALWWLTLSSLVGHLRSHIGAHTLTVVNRLCGTVLTAFGLYALAALLPPL